LLASLGFLFRADIKASLKREEKEKKADS
jgi:hypothetical protein